MTARSMNPFGRLDPQQLAQLYLALTFARSHELFACEAVDHVPALQREVSEAWKRSAPKPDNVTAIKP